MTTIRWLIADAGDFASSALKPLVASTTDIAGGRHLDRLDITDVGNFSPKRLSDRKFQFTHGIQ